MSHRSPPMSFVAQACGVNQIGRLVGARVRSVVIATVHPSSLLRIPDPEDRERAKSEFFNDLRIVARQLKAG